MSETLLETKTAWGPLREMIFWIVVCTLIAIGSCEGGYIIGHRNADETQAELRKLNSWVLDHGGRIESLETVDRRDRTGSGRPAKSDAKTR